MNDKTVFAERLREVRTDMHLSQSQFSDFLNIPKATLSNYENHKLVPTLKNLVKIAKKCKISLDWLCGLTENKICTCDMSVLLTELMKESDAGASFQVQITKISNNK